MSALHICAWLGTLHESTMIVILVPTAYCKMAALLQPLACIFKQEEKKGRKEKETYLPVEAKHFPGIPSGLS